MNYRSLNDLFGYRIAADGESVGSVSDFYVDDSDWEVRYLVADTGNWLTQRRILLPPASISDIDYERSEIGLSLSPDAIADAPGVDTDLPVSRQKETELLKHYGWTPYWGAALPEAGAGFGGAAMSSRQIDGDVEMLERQNDPNLRSTNEVAGYSIECSDGHVGSLSNMVVPANGWIVRYLVVDTGKWLPGREVIISPEWVERIDWHDRTVHTGLTRESIRESAPFGSVETLDRKYEEDLYAHYSLIPYW